MSNTFIILICLYLVIGIIAFYCFLRPEFHNFFADFNEIFIEDQKLSSELLRVVCLFIFIVIVALVLAIYPILFLIRYLNGAEYANNYSTKDKDEVIDQSSHEKHYDEPRIYNPGYDKLIFSLTGKFVGEESEEILKLKTKYNAYNYYCVPIIYNYKQQNDIILNGSKRDDFESRKIGLFILETTKYFDPPGESTFEVFPTLSNTNYAFRTHDQEISASALSTILEIEIDGVDKLLFWKKRNPKEIIIVNINEFKDPFDFQSLFTESKYTSHKLNDDILNLLADYFSLHWKNSTMKENESLRETAHNIKLELYKRFINNNQREVTNLFHIVEYRKPYVLYSRRIPEEEEIKIRRLTLIKPLEQIHKMYPDYDIDILKQYRSIEVSNKLKQLENEENLDYKSKIFLKSANMINSLLTSEEIDYSAVTIGYSKFFEREVNLSIVQLIRKELGINMPYYYEQYCDVNGNYFVKIDNDFKVNFNMQERTSGKYLPPGLGQSLICFNTMSKQLVYYISKYKELISLGKKLNSIRNKSAHPDLINKKDVDNIKEIIVELYIQGAFKEMISIKEKLCHSKSGSIS